MCLLAWVFGLFSLGEQQLFASALIGTFYTRSIKITLLA
jgi:hypothetical protein